MAQPEKQQFGDGSDDYAGAARNMAKAAGQETVKQTANAAAATVKAGVESGKAVSEIAAGTAAGGPAGAVIAAAWSMRHSLFKVLVCIGLGLLLIITLVVSLPSIVTDSIFGLNGKKPAEGATLRSAYDEMAEAVSEVIEDAYEEALKKVDEMITDGGYDYDESMENIINYAQGQAGYDVCYILAAYSASMKQQGVSKEDMLNKLKKVSGEMFPVSSEEKETTREVAASYFTYKEKEVTVITKKVKKKKKIRYETAKKTFFVQDEEKTSDKEIEIQTYKKVRVEVPVYGSSGKIKGTKKETYYKKGGKKTIKPKTETVKYLECTIQSFDNSVIEKAFDIDLNVEYEGFGVTYKEAIENMAKALKMTLYGSETGGESVPLTDKELIAFVDMQECNETRKHILRTALSLVGKVPYFWGGKSGPGWNEEWNRPKLVTAAGSSTTGTVRPYGLDCSGFTAWTYSTALGVNIGAGTRGQYPNSTAVSKKDLLPGDLGFRFNGGSLKHVLMFAGYDKHGTQMWVHCTSGKGVTLGTYSHASTLSLRRPKGVDFNAPVASSSSYGKPLSTLDVDVTHYCSCKKCCGKWAGGHTASGKVPMPGMVAMSSHYPFGTLIEINGTMYTVEDRGGTGIENNIHRVDIYVSDHATALRLGRFKTKAKIYRLGR